MERRYVLSVLVQNNSGVLARVSGLFSRRGYNISSLTVGETINRRYSRMTIELYGNEATLEQIKKQLGKLVEVEKIAEIEQGSAVFRELMLVKVHAEAGSRAGIIELCNVFHRRSLAHHRHHRSHEQERDQQRAVKPAGGIRHHRDRPDGHRRASERRALSGAG